MKLRNITMTGLLLLSAAAIIKAGEPVNEPKDHGNDNGRLFPHSNSGNAPANVLSCSIASSPFQCTKSIETISTSYISLQDSFVGIFLTDQTIGNTSDTRAISGDQTSVVE